MEGLYDESLTRDQADKESKQLMNRKQHVFYCHKDSHSTQTMLNFKSTLGLFTPSLL